jgi:uncharacterized membrane protein
LPRVLSFSFFFFFSFVVCNFWVSDHGAFPQFENLFRRLISIEDYILARVTVKGK